MAAVRSRGLGAAVMLSMLLPGTAFGNQAPTAVQTLCVLDFQRL
jgi:hypothetical protein